MACLLGVVVLAFIPYLLFRMRRLGRDEIDTLAGMYRALMIEDYYRTNGEEVSVNPGEVEDLRPEGQLRIVNTPLYDFPARVAAWLKHKEREWIVVGIEKNRFVETVWINEGPGASFVKPKRPTDDFVSMARWGRADGLVILHNHLESGGLPRPEEPSEEDVAAAARMGETLKTHRLNLVEFVCFQGRARRYHLSCCDQFFSLRLIGEAIGRSRRAFTLRNLRFRTVLHGAKPAVTWLKDQRE